MNVTFRMIPDSVDQILADANLRSSTVLNKRHLSKIMSMNHVLGCNEMGLNFLFTFSFFQSKEAERRLFPKH